METLESLAETSTSPTQADPTTLPAKRPRGRPRLSEEEKARRAAERKQRRAPDKVERDQHVQALLSYAKDGLEEAYAASHFDKGPRTLRAYAGGFYRLPSGPLLGRILEEQGEWAAKEWIDLVWLPLIGSKLVDGCSLAEGDVTWHVPALRRSTYSVAKFERWCYESLPELERILLEQDAIKQEQAAKKRSLREELPDPLEDDPLDPRSWPALLSCVGVSRETDGKEITHLTCRAMFGRGRLQESRPEFLPWEYGALLMEDANEKEMALIRVPEKDRSWVARRPFLFKKIVMQVAESLLPLTYASLPEEEKEELKQKMTKKQFSRLMRKLIKPDSKIFPRRLFYLDTYRPTGRVRESRQEQRLTKEQMTKLGHTTVPGNIPLDNSPECMAYPFGERLRAFVHREDLKKYGLAKFKVKFKGDRKGDEDATYLKAYGTAKTAMSVLTPWGKVHINQLLVAYVTGKYYDRVAPPKEVSFGWLKENLLWEQPAIPAGGSGTLVLLKRAGKIK
ncbi:MAG: hypothetical protein EOM21_15930 [Gammaproteobacteria bacterium]|nr:hypothetical protein [Gammaproteobacteria bacterium]